MTITDIAPGGAAHGARPEKKRDHTPRTLMTWLALLAAIACDVAATYALAASHGFRNPLPTMLAVAGFLLATYLFAVALTGLSPSISYAAFGALGTAAVAVIGIVIGAETTNWIKIGSLTLIIIGVVMLPLADRQHGGRQHGDHREASHSRAGHGETGLGRSAGDPVPRS